MKKLKSKPKEPVRHAEFRALMTKVNAYCLNVLDGPPCRESSRLEWWQCKRGTLLAQLWESGGVTVSASWGLGQTWDELEAIINSKESPERECARLLAMVMLDVMAQMGRLALNKFDELNRGMILAERLFPEVIEQLQKKLSGGT